MGASGWSVMEPHKPKGLDIIVAERRWRCLVPKLERLATRAALAGGADGATVVRTLDEALTDENPWVIGGAQIYALALPQATRCEITEVDVALPREDDDVVAPVLDDAWSGTVGDWLTSASGLRYRFSSYVRA